MAHNHIFLKPAFDIGDQVQVVGEYASDWKDDDNLRVSSIRYLRDWRRYDYEIMDSGGYVCDGWEADDLQLKSTRDRE